MKTETTNIETTDDDSMKNTWIPPKLERLPNENNINGGGGGGSEATGLWES